MPIYAYRCEACGHAKDVLQKMSDPVLTTCPSCGAESFKKQVTAAGFQLKGSGWYVTDFRGGSGGGAAATGGATAAASTSGDAAPASSGGSDSSSASSASSSSSSDSGGSSGAAGCAGSCACH
ncbi:MAG TPA: zinc ribbon domain-containing protein [Candidatus Aquabacterium excrementipullorum]|nr:zinc ribbon domain-containing protein [Candidatus Aquabacterium excrementipullorum]